MIKAQSINSIEPIIFNKFLPLSNFSEADFDSAYIRRNLNSLIVNYVGSNSEIFWSDFPWGSDIIFKISLFLVLFCPVARPIMRLPTTSYPPLSHGGNLWRSRSLPKRNPKDTSCRYGIGTFRYITFWCFQTSRNKKNIEKKRESPQCR